MNRGHRFHHKYLFAVLAVTGTVLLGTGGFEPVLAAAKKQQGAPTHRDSPAVQTALRYAEAVSKGDRVLAGQLDFACQYRLVAQASGAGKQFPPPSDPLYESCWKELTAAHAPALTRSDIAMDVIWPSTGPLVFFGDELPRMPASAFVMDAIGISPPGSGLHLAPAKSATIPAGSFRLQAGGKVRRRWST